MTEPTDARPDELAGIREKIARQLTKLIYGDVATWKDLHSEGKLLMLDRADQILSLTVSSGKDCPDCEGYGGFYQGSNETPESISFCPTCNGTGHTEVVTKELREIIKEHQDGH